MSKEDNIKVMNETAKTIIKILNARLSIRVEALKAFEPNALDSYPDEVKITREQEAAKLRAVIQEQRDIVELLNVMYPNA